MKKQNDKNPSQQQQEEQQSSIPAVKKKNPIRPTPRVQLPREHVGKSSIPHHEPYSSLYRLPQASPPQQQVGPIYYNPGVAQSLFTNAVNNYNMMQHWITAGYMPDTSHRPVSAHLIPNGSNQPVYGVLQGMLMNPLLNNNVIGSSSSSSSNCRSSSSNGRSSMMGHRINNLHISSALPTFPMSMKMPSKIIFLNKFRDHYVRNNRSKGQKNLRCFPHCNTSGHTDHGFCGAMLACRGITPRGYSRVRCFAEIRVASITGTRTKGLVSTETPAGLTPGVTVPTESVMKVVKTTENPFVKLFELATKSIDMSGISHIVTEFSLAPPSWHYGWRSSKYAKNYVHYVRAYLCVENGNYLSCVAIVDSDKFRISSSKRCRANGVINGETYDESVDNYRKEKERKNELKRKRKLQQFDEKEVLNLDVNSSSSVKRLKLEKEKQDNVVTKRKVSGNEKIKVTNLSQQKADDQLLSLASVAGNFKG